MSGHPAALHPGRAGVGRAVLSAHAAPPPTQHATSDRRLVLAQLRRGARGGKLATAGWSAGQGARGGVRGCLGFPWPGPGCAAGCDRACVCGRVRRPRSVRRISEGRGWPAQGLPDQAASVFPLRRDPACLWQETLEGW